MTRVIGVIGNGMIGDSITVLTTGHGQKTLSLVRNKEKIPAYKQTFDGYYKQMMDHGLLDEEQFHICEKYLSYTDDYGDLKDCEVILNASLRTLPQSRKSTGR